MKRKYKPIKKIELFEIGNLEIREGKKLIKKIPLSVIIPKYILLKYGRISSSVTEDKLIKRRG